MMSCLKGRRIETSLAFLLLYESFYNCPAKAVNESSSNLSEQSHVTLPPTVMLGVAQGLQLN